MTEFKIGDFVHIVDTAYRYTQYSDFIEYFKSDVEGSGIGVICSLFQEDAAFRYGPNDVFRVWYVHKHLALAREGYVYVVSNGTDTYIMGARGLSPVEKPHRFHEGDIVHITSTGPVFSTYKNFIKYYELSKGEETNEAVVSQYSYGFSPREENCKGKLFEVCWVSSHELEGYNDICIINDGHNTYVIEERGLELSCTSSSKESALWPQYCLYLRNWAIAHAEYNPASEENLIPKTWYEFKAMKEASDAR